MTWFGSFASMVVGGYKGPSIQFCVSRVAKSVEWPSNGAVEVSIRLPKGQLSRAVSPNKNCVVSSSAVWWAVPATSTWPDCGGPGAISAASHPESARDVVADSLECLPADIVAGCPSAATWGLLWAQIQVSPSQQRQ